MTRDKQKARTAAMLATLRTDAINALETYEAWAPSAYASGRCTPVQFFAVLLWAAGTRRELSESDELRVVSDWWSALVSVTVKRCAQLGGHGPFRHVYPLDEITLLELAEPAVTRPHGWCMSCDEIDCWAASIGQGELCAVFFQACGLRGQVIDMKAGQSAGAASGISALAVTTRTRAPRSDWTEEQEALLESDYRDANCKSASKKHEAVAKLWSMKPGSVKQQLARIKKKRKEAGSIGATARNLAGTK